jgi:hypothetical protein
LTADGLVSLFQAAQWSMDLALKFDGNGSISAREQLTLCGADVEATLAARFTPGFKSIELKALLNVDVDLKLFRADASVQVEARSPGSPAVSVVARAVGAEAAFELERLDDLTPPRVAEELAKQLGNMLQNIAAAASEWEKDKKVLLASWDKHWKDEISDQAKRLGLDHWDTGNPEVNRLLGQVAQDGKNLGGWLSDAGKNGGKEVSEFIKNPAARASELPRNIGRELGNLPQSVVSTVGGLLGMGRRKPSQSDDGPSPAELKAKDWSDRFNKRLEPRVQALNDPGLRIDVVPDAARRKASGNETLLTRRGS